MYEQHGKIMHIFRGSEAGNRTVVGAACPQAWKIIRAAVLTHDSAAVCFGVHFTEQFIITQR